jgi:hypothetical protein
MTTTITVLLVLLAACVVCGLVLLTAGSKSTPPKGYGVQQMTATCTEIHSKVDKNGKPLYQAEFKYWLDGVYHFSRPENWVQDAEINIGDETDIYLNEEDNSVCWYCRAGNLAYYRNIGYVFLIPAVLLALGLIFDVIASAGEVNSLAVSETATEATEAEEFCNTDYDEQLSVRNLAEEAVKAIRARKSEYIVRRTDIDILYHEQYGYPETGSGYDYNEEQLIAMKLDDILEAADTSDDEIVTVFAYFDAYDFDYDNIEVVDDERLKELNLFFQSEAFSEKADYTVQKGYKIPCTLIGDDSGETGYFYMIAINGTWKADLCFMSLSNTYFSSTEQ